jgi:hypothetical protein
MEWRTGRPAKRPGIIEPCIPTRAYLRGPRGAQFEFTLAATAQNLRRMGKLVPRPPDGRRKWPDRRF